MNIRKIKDKNPKECFTTNQILTALKIWMWQKNNEYYESICVGSKTLDVKKAFLN